MAWNSKPTTDTTTTTTAPTTTAGTDTGAKDSEQKQQQQAKSIFGSVAAPISGTPLFGGGGGGGGFTAPTTTTTTTAGTTAGGDINTAPRPPTGAATGTTKKEEILPPAGGHVATGEEEEQTVFSTSAKLFAYSNEKKEWSLKGAGTVKVNVNEERKQARLVMRRKDTLTLLLNASIWAGLNLAPMEGGSGLRFTCLNHIGQHPGGEGEGEASARGLTGAGGEDGHHLTVFALRFGAREAEGEFKAAVEAHTPVAGKSLE